MLFTREHNPSVFEKTDQTFLAEFIYKWRQSSEFSPFQLLMITSTSQAAVALWKCILRFMGDLPEPKHYAVEKDNTPMMSKVSATLGRNFSKSKQFQELGQLQENGDGSGEVVDKKLVSLTLKRQDKMGENIKQRLMDEDGAEASYSDWLDARPTTNMEKLHFITGDTATAVSI